MSAIASAVTQSVDPVCGMTVDKATALRTDRGGRSFSFCGVGCQRTFESPEAELRSMRRRVTIALTGVLALAIGHALRNERGARPGHVGGWT